MAVSWIGLQEFRSALENLPERLHGESSNIVIEAAKTAERDTRSGYPQGPTGNLKRGVTTTVEEIGRGGTSARVKSNARHAHLFEGGYRGKKERRAVPADQQMIPYVVRARRQMVVKLIQMVTREGLVVTSS